MNASNFKIQPEREYLVRGSGRRITIKGRTKIEDPIGDGSKCFWSSHGDWYNEQGQRLQVRPVVVDGRTVGIRYYVTESSPDNLVAIEKDGVYLGYGVFATYRQGEIVLTEDHNDQRIPKSISLDRRQISRLVELAEDSDLA